MPKRTPERAWVTVDLGSPDLRKEVQELADASERTLSAEIRVAVKKHLADARKAKRKPARAAA